MAVAVTDIDCVDNIRNMALPECFKDFIAVVNGKLSANAGADSVLFKEFSRSLSGLDIKAKVIEALDERKAYRYRQL